MRVALIGVWFKGDKLAVMQRKFMGWSRELIVLIVLTFSTQAASALYFHDDDDGPQSFKEVVERLVRSSRENLRPLKTFRIEKYPGRDYWYEVEVKLPGAKSCRIYEHPQMVYRCEWNRAANESAKSVYTSVVKSMTEALESTNWMVRKSPESSSVTRFEPVNPRRYPVFEVRLAGERRDAVIEVLLFAVDRWGSKE